MDVRTLRALEWDRVLALLSLCASTAEGKARAGALLPEADADKVRERHARVAECLAGEALSGRLSLEGYVRTPTRLPAGLSFPLETFRQLRRNLRAYRDVRGWLEDPAAAKATLAASFPRIASLDALGTKMERLLDDRGEVADTASDRLRAIRRERERARGQVLARMETLSSTLGTGVLREATYTVRNGRLVLPVQSSRRSEVKGILHDTSSTGATAFIEPLEVVDLNNRLTAMDAEEREEVQRVLLENTGAVSACWELLESVFDEMERLDVDLASGRLGKACSGILPQLDDTGRMEVVAGRHPLLDKGLARLRKEAWGEEGERSAVPLDLSMSEDGQRTLVISGPNAGGKSVALKTVGLLCVMHQAGIPIPAAEGTRLPVFPFFHATVGDAQSILDSLSTFSARMAAIRDALASLREPFLVLLDEVGSGTDPHEGAALGEAILLHLHARRGFTLCSTHYEAVKARALVTEGMGNAGMEFEEATGRPTYRLKMGQVGASRALEIAERSGLPASILDEARALLPEGEKHLKEVLNALEAEIEAHEREQERLKHRMSELEGTRRDLEQARRGLEAEKERLLATIPQRASEWEEAFLAQLKAEVNRQSVKKVSRKAVAEAVETAAETLKVKQPAARAAAALPQKGDRVRVKGFGVDGTVMESDAGSGRLLLDCDGKSLTVGMGDVEVLQGVQAAKPRRGGVGVPSQDATWEINLIGQTGAEAEAALEPFLDRAVLVGLGELRIIHGIGTGRLKSAVRALLRRTPEVASFEDAPPAGGGAGVTLVSLKG
jgi:DNA mismatch repair protein MutS2